MDTCRRARGARRSPTHLSLGLGKGLEAGFRGGLPFEVGLGDREGCGAALPLPLPFSLSDGRGNGLLAPFATPFALSDGRGNGDSRCSAGAGAIAHLCAQHGSAMMGQHDASS